MDLWGSLIESPTIHQPIRQANYSAYVVLRRVGRNNSVSSTEDLESFERKHKVVYGCRHFPEVETEAKANWPCEFCGGARLIEHATRSNEIVLSLEINELLCNFYANYESSDEAIMSPMNCARASKSTWTLSPNPKMTEEPEGAMAVNTIDESTSLCPESVGELPLFEQLTYDDVRETSLCSCPQMEETSCTERGSPGHCLRL